MNKIYAIEIGNCNIYVDLNEGNDYIDIKENVAHIGLELENIKDRSNRNTNKVFEKIKRIVANLLFDNKFIIEGNRYQKKDIDLNLIKEDGGIVSHNKYKYVPLDKDDNENIINIAGEIYWGVYYSYTSPYKYKSNIEDRIHKIDTKIKSNELILYIDNEKFLINYKEKDFLKNVLIPNIRKQKILLIDENVKPDIFKQRVFPVYRKTKTIQFINEENKNDYNTENYYVINIYNKNDEEILESITRIGELEYPAYIDNKYEYASKDKREILLYCGGLSCLISIIDGHWYINNENVISYRESNTDNLMMEENLELNKNRIIKGFEYKFRDAMPETIELYLDRTVDNLFEKKLMYRFLASWLTIKKKL